MKNPLPYDLAYFSEWGGRSWQALIRTGIGELQGKNSLKGAELLEIGAGTGKMAILFSLLGANVTGIETQEQSLAVAQEEAKKWNASRVKFIAYNGDLDMFPDESFDIIFTKSVLVIVPNLGDFLEKISRKLRPNGQAVFIENGRGNVFLHALRMLKPRELDYRRINYFTEKQVRLIQSIYDVNMVKKTFYPPVYLFLARKRTTGMY